MACVVCSRKVYDALSAATKGRPMTEAKAKARWNSAQWVVIAVRAISRNPLRARREPRAARCRRDRPRAEDDRHFGIRVDGQCHYRRARARASVASTSGSGAIQRLAERARDHDIVARARRDAGGHSNPDQGGRRRADAKARQIVAIEADPFLVDLILRLLGRI